MVSIWIRSVMESERGSNGDGKSRRERAGGGGKVGFNRSSWGKGIREEGKKGFRVLKEGKMEVVVSVSVSV